MLRCGVFVLHLIRLAVSHSLFSFPLAFDFHHSTLCALRSKSICLLLHVEIVYPMPQAATVFHTLTYAHHTNKNINGIEK